MDNSATSPVKEEVFNAMIPYLKEEFGNPSTFYKLGRDAKKAVEEARANVAQLINADTREIIFTSGGTESDNMAIKGAALKFEDKGKHIITTEIEHPAVLRTCEFLETRGFEVTYLPVQENGIINIDDLKNAIREDTILISIMHANNEIGTIQPIEEVGKIAKENGILFHCDAVQSVGKIPVDVKAANIDLLSIFVSAIIHDYGHPGLNNNYLIRTKDNLSIKYNDISVLENYHVSEAFNIILKKQDNNILSNLSDDDYKLCRKNIIECVLGTDMTLHNQKYQTFKIRLQTENIKKGEGLEQFLLKQDPINLYNLKLEFLSFIIHAADISNPTKPLPIYREWAQRCVEEFFKQGDLEKKLGLPISFNCDRNTVSLPKSQLGFMDAIVSPLFTVFNEYFPQISFTLDNLKKNHKYYKEIVEKEKNLKK
jgi:hypothetical protein